MERNELKRQMMNLWKETFHDSEEYIRLVFDAYFDPEYVEYEERDGRIIACLLAIPYTFGNNNYSINSVYLCGLSTYYKNRGEGIMTHLIQKIEIKMRQKGYAFMFLIPANSGLRRYYNDRGFINGFYRSALHYTSLHDFKRDFHTSISNEENALFEVKKRYFDGLTIEIIDRIEALDEPKVNEGIIRFILECEEKQKGLSLFQSPEQIGVFQKETILSGGKVVICRNGDGEYAAIGLYSVSENEIKENGRFAINYGSLCKLREAVLLTGDGRNLTVYQYGYENNSGKESVWNPMFSSVFPQEGQVGAVGTMERVYNPNSHSEVYGMIRILSISEILKFLSNWRR
ncbi:MAG: GNAT family N-acetyltransferase, partial [Muribaculaceae bacterium]|nr:GNAT family N-acetyltransferase [Muribaculaceae bacterium]